MLLDIKKIVQNTIQEQRNLESKNSSSHTEVNKSSNDLSLEIDTLKQTQDVEKTQFEIEDPIQIIVPQIDDKPLKYEDYQVIVAK